MLYISFSTRGRGSQPVIADLLPEAGPMGLQERQEWAAAIAGPTHPACNCSCTSPKNMTGRKADSVWPGARGHNCVQEQWTWQFPELLDQACNISSGCNRNAAPVRSHDRRWPSSATCCSWPVQWGTGALCVVTESTTVQLLTLSIKILLKLTCK